MGDIAFLEDGPRVLSIYEGFFSGGARMVHNAVVRSLDATTSQPLAALVGIGTAGRPVVTCLHRSDFEHQGAGLEALVALVDQGVVTTAVCCAHSTQAAYHAATGIPLDRLPVIPNGVDLHRFRPDSEQRETVRRRLGAAHDAPVVLLSARFDPMKDVALFVRAAAEFVAAYPHAQLVLCGALMAATNPALVGLLDEALRGWVAAQERVHLLGIRADMPWRYNAADLVVLTSAYGESAPLSLLEGMACGAVPVTTDVGDDRSLVPGREPAEVALAWTAAFEQREQHTERILRRRQRLSEQLTFDAYAALLNDQVRRVTLEVAV